MSFQGSSSGHVTFVGLENFRNLFNADFYKAVSNSLIYTVITIAVLYTTSISIVGSFGQQKNGWKELFRAVLFCRHWYLLLLRFYLQIDFW